ncbi:MAG: PEGA domain-containing protein [Myxococcales bacterium]|nr:PEGA domain-containing protein [Myxococcales bacterium]
MATGIATQPFPQQFGRYYLLGKIAMGGMAEIFRAKSVGAEGFEKVVVIKRILPHFCEDEGFVTMFQDEARVAAHLTHANVVQIFDFDEVDGLFFIAMEYVEGADLKRVLDVGAKKGRPLSIAQSVAIMIEASQGLHYAHTRIVEGQPLNIIHRDVSPHNVMVSYNGEVKIMDFGIAKAASRSTKTRVGTVKGKCAYMSPEQARGKPLDGRSDLFALGVCLWEMLTGKRLFVGESDFETLNNVLKAEVPPPSELNPEIPKELDAIVLKSLARERDNRQADVGGFVSELRRWFYSAVPDPEAIAIKTYMNDLFDDDITRLRSDTAHEAQLMDQMRKGGSSSSTRKVQTGSQPALRSTGADDERTMALDAAGQISGPGDADRTMALPDAMNQLGLGSRPHGATNFGRTMVGQEAMAPKKSNVGLFVGLGILVVGIAAVAAFVAMRPRPVEPTAAMIAAPAIRFKMTIKAKGAAEISVNDELVCTNKDECAYEGDKGAELRVLARNGDRKQLEKVTLDRENMVVEVKLPDEEKKVEAPQLAATAPTVIVEVDPANATLTVNGRPLALTNGNAKVPDVKLGDNVKIEAKAEGFKTETKEFLIKNPTVETLKIVMQKDKPAPPVGGGGGGGGGGGSSTPAATSPGKVVVTAKPWAKVSIKGKDYGLTPVTFSLPAGKHSVTLTKGAVTKSVSVTIKAGGSSSVSADMNAE